MLGVLGEVLITVGVLVFAFLGWQLWLNDLVVGGNQNSVGSALGSKWSAGSASGTKTGSSATGPGLADSSTPVVGAVADKGAKFAVMYVPRFGSDYARSVSEGVDSATILDRSGIGHYPGTQLPGEIGNFAVAAHRTTHGAPFKQIATLQIGDRIYLQTADGYYTYLFRGLQYVPASSIEVLAPVPQLPGVTATDRVLTMTSCSPQFSAAERIIAYAVLESWQPTSVGTPAAIAAAVDAKK